MHFLPLFNRNLSTLIYSFFPLLGHILVTYQWLLLTRHYIKNIDMQGAMLSPNPYGAQISNNDQVISSSSLEHKAPSNRWFHSRWQRGLSIHDTNITNTSHRLFYRHQPNLCVHSYLSFIVLVFVFLVGLPTSITSHSASIHLHGQVSSFSFLSLSSSSACEKYTVSGGHSASLSECQAWCGALVDESVVSSESTSLF